MCLFLKENSKLVAWYASPILECSLGLPKNMDSLVANILRFFSWVRDGPLEITSPEWGFLTKCRTCVTH